MFRHKKAMATMMLASPFRRLFQDLPKHGAVTGLPKDVENGSPTPYIKCCPRANFVCSRSLICCSSSRAGLRVLVKPISAVDSGLEASITDPEDNIVSIKNVEIVVESKDDDKMQVKVNLSGKETQIVFDKVLRNLASSAPPIPGFRREKGGKTSKVPKDFLLQILGEDRVTNFVLQQIIESTLGDYVKKENLNVKDNKVTTIQSAKELKSAFVPGKDFGFNATMELEESAEGSS